MELQTLFKCPVCAKALFRNDKSYYCRQGHTYDLARQGYVNLLLPSHTGSGNPGDSREMLQSRRGFLNAGYYQRFSQEVNEIVLQLFDQDQINLLDAGCGEGYYTWRLKTSLQAAEKALDIYGVDVSKGAVQYAAGRDKSIRFAVASTYHLPIQDCSMDCIICLFAPRDQEEFARVLREKGKLIVAAPGPGHLYSLRKIIYEDPENIGQRGDVNGGFTLLDQVNAAYTVELDNSRDILNLLTMTPYSKHADEAALAKLKGLTRLQAEIDINLLVYGKNSR